MTGTERKALNKYYPPDFDPRKIPKVKSVDRNRQYVIRVMAPFNMKCNTCGEYIYKGKKFNARRETVEDDSYLGLFLFRFYIRCPQCLAEITFKTDLKNCDYAAEHGSTRLFEADKALQEMAKEKERQEEEDKQNAMKQLEKRTKMSRFEMEALERLEELRELKHREGKVDYESIISDMSKQQRDDLIRQEREDEEFVKRLFAKDCAQKTGVKREHEDEDEDEDEMPSSSSSGSSVQQPKPPPPLSSFAKKPKTDAMTSQRHLLKMAVVRKRKKDQEDPPTTTKPSSAPAPTPAPAGSETSTGATGLSLLGAYSSSSSSEDEAN